MKQLLSTALLLISGLAAQVPTPRSCDYLPFHEGNLWTYKLDNGAAMTISVDAVEEVKGTPCWKVVMKANGQVFKEEWLAVDATGVRCHRTKSQEGDMEYGKPVLRMQLPMSNGVTFSSFAHDFDGSDIKGEHTVRGPVRVKSGGKDWEAFSSEARYEAAKGESRSVTWFAKGVGIVKQEMSGPQGRLVCELVDVSLQGQDQTEPQRQTKTKFCAECGKPLVPGKKFCTECGKPVVATKGEASERPTLDLVPYASADKKVKLFMPRDWKVQTGEIFGENTYGVQLEAQNQEAGVLLIAMKVEEGKVENSVHLASVLLAGIKKQIPSLEVGEIASNKESTRTCATVTYADGGKSYRGTFYFFLAQHVGTFLGYGAEVTKFDALRPMLVNIVSNLAYSPNGIDATETKARQAATESDAMVGKETDGPQHRTGTPLARLAAAKKQQVDTPLQVTRAQNGSMTMLMPRGWTLQNDNGKYLAYSDQQGTHGISMSWSNIWLPDRSGLGMDQTAAAVGQKVAPAMAPAQALCWLLEANRIGTQLRILGVNTGAELGKAAQEAQSAAMRNNSQSAAQLVEIEFTLSTTGKRTRGIFYVQCTYPNLGNVWSIFTAGHWAPAERYEQLLPMFVKMSESYAMDQNWAVARHGQQTADLQASQQKMFQSINDLGKQYERNNASWRESQRSQDYLSAMRSQTTLGQGTWIAQHEGGESVNTYSWGAEDHQGNQAVGQPWNTTNFKGQSPFTGQQLEEVNSRQVWERYQGMR